MVCISSFQLVKYHLTFSSKQSRLKWASLALCLYHLVPGFIKPGFCVLKAKPKGLMCHHALFKLKSTGKGLQKGKKETTYPLLNLPTPTPPPLRPSAIPQKESSLDVDKFSVFLTSFSPQLPGRPLSGRLSLSPARTSAAARGRRHPAALNGESPWRRICPELDKFLPKSPSHAETLILTVSRAAGMAIRGQLHYWEH